MRDGADATYGAAARVLASWQEGRSLFSAEGLPVWSRETVEEACRRFLDNPDSSGAKFPVKLGRQMAGASAAATELVAELLYAYCLTFVPAAMGVTAKLRLIRGALRMNAGTVEDVPADLVAGLQGGIAHPGMFYLRRVDAQLAYLLRLAASLAEVTPEVRAGRLSDAWEFRSWLDGVPLGSGDGMRGALLNLFFPDTFESIIAKTDKSKILRFFADEFTGETTGDEDRDLLELRAGMGLSGQPYAFYRPPHDGWRPRKGRRHRGWLVSPQNGQLVADWLTEARVSLQTAFEDWTPDLSTAKEVRAAVDARMVDAPVTARRHQALWVHRLLAQVRAGHVAVATDKSGIHVGRFTNDQPTWTETGHGLLLSRTVSWIAPEQPVARDELPDDLGDVLGTDEPIRSLGSHADRFLAAAQPDPDEASSRAGEDGPEDEVLLVGTADLLPNPTRELAEALFVPDSWLQDLFDTLRERRRVILYGPPGTGKTFLAQRLAEFVKAQSGGTTRVVQFHPSYAYEDFFQGYRPRAGEDGALGFSLVDGPLRLIASQAEQDPDSPHVLIIDEINRANIAKVFGELYFLLEYGEAGVPLQYSPEETFRLPPNVFLVGTMNTADRSVALVDQAMRRRFDFVPLFPGRVPLTTMLRDWLDARGYPSSVADLLDALNRRLDDPESSVGPSYFMTDRVATAAGLDRVWRTSIVPLLEERFAGDGRDLATEWSMEAVLRGDARERPDRTRAARPDFEDGESGGEDGDDDL